MGKRIFLLTGLLCLLILVSPVYTMPWYTITDLGMLPGFTGSEVNSINNSGQAVGDAYTQEGNSQAFLFNNGTMTGLGTLPGGTGSFAYDINDSGQVVGFSRTASGPNHAALFSNGSVIDLGTLPGDNWSFAYSINDAGQAVGYSYQATNGRSHATLYSNGTVIDLGTLQGGVSRAISINNSGQAVGSSTVADGGPNHAALFSNGSVIDLGTLPGDRMSYAYDINDSGQVVGYSYSSIDGSTHAVLFSNGIVVDLGTLGGSQSAALSINESGQAVGRSETANGETHAAIFSNGIVTDLNSLVNAATGWTLYAAYGINDKGQIVANGSSSNVPVHSFILSPSWSAIVTYENNYIINMTMGNTFSFDYWWEMGQNPTGFNLDILFFSGSKWNSFMGWELNFDGSSTGWKTASFTVPENLRGLATQIDFRVFDLGAVTDPTVYLRNIASNGAAPVPEPTTLLLLGSGLLMLGMVSFRNKIVG
jgi:probable HAF family extracellular repeat protein